MSKMQNFVKQFQELQTTRVNLDKREKQFASDLRTEFPTGDTGDVQFLKFATDELRAAPHKAQYLLMLAVTARACPNENEYKLIGITDMQRKLANLPVREQVQIIEKARKEHVSVKSVLMQRERASAPPKSKPIQLSRIAAILDQHWDALERAGIPITELSEFVAQYGKKLRSVG